MLRLPIHAKTKIIICLVTESFRYSAEDLLNSNIEQEDDDNLTEDEDELETSQAPIETHFNEKGKECVRCPECHVWQEKKYGLRMHLNSKKCADQKVINESNAPGGM
jgi:hypothetical protein